MTETIVIVSKPPSASVAKAVLDTARASGKPVVVYFMGQFTPTESLGNLHFAQSLTHTAELALSTNPEPVEGWDSAIKGNIRGLFSGGTLAYETVIALQAVLDINTNVPIGNATQIDDLHQSMGHTIIDMGEDEFTQGRLHPMMDNDLRVRRLRQEVADADTGLILLDVVLGEGAHPDPASELAPVLAESETPALVLLIGTDEDPQGLDAQKQRFEESGARVCTDLGAFIDQIVATIANVGANSGVRIHGSPLPILEKDALRVINVGVETFYDSLTDQGAEVVQVEWRPPAGGNDKLAAILAKMKG